MNALLVILLNEEELIMENVFAKMGILMMEKISYALPVTIIVSLVPDHSVQIALFVEIYRFNN
jgi:hypothetical protein